MNHTQSNATPPQATPAETPRNEEGTVSKIEFAFEDVINAQIRSAGVDVHIPWYVIDPQGRNIRNQRLREHARKHLDQQTADTSKFQARFKQASTSRILKSARQLPAPGSDNKDANEEEATTGGTSSGVHTLPFFDSLTLFPAWHFVATAALLFTVAVTPFEVGFLGAPATVDDLNALFYINRVVDLVFIVDIILQFFIMVPKQEGGQAAWGQPADGTTLVWETRLSEIARRYALGWFPIDVISVAPFIFDILPLLDPEGSSSAGGAKALRTIRALRLIKLLRLLRASRVFGPLKERIALPFVRLTLVRLLLQTVIIAHALACLVAIITTFAASPLDTWLATFGYCKPAVPPIDLRNGLRLEDCVSPAERYKASLSWGLGILVNFQEHPSPGPFEPFYSDVTRELPLTVGEEVTLLMLKVVCLFAWTIIFGQLLAALTQSDPERMRYQGDLDSINRFCERHSLSTDLTIEVRRYFFQTLSINYAESRKAALAKLSPALAEKITWTVNEPWLTKLRFYSYVHKKVVEKSPATGERSLNKFLSKIVMRMQPAVFAPREVPPMPRLYFITAGTILRTSSSGKRETLVAGRCWGAGEVMSLASGRAALSAVAASYVHVQWIGPDELRMLRPDHPEAFKHLRMWAMLRDVALHMTQLMRKTPPALRQEDLTAGAKISLLRWSGGLNRQPDPPRALMIVNGEERLVRFREKDFRARWGRFADGISPDLFGPLEVEAVDGKAAGGLIQLKGGKSLPNPFLLLDSKQADKPPLSLRGHSGGLMHNWTNATLREAKSADLWRLKREASELVNAVDTALQEKMEAAEKDAAAWRRMSMMA